MPAVKPAKVMLMVIPTVLATIQSLEGSPTEVLFTSVARRELSIVLVGVLAGDVFGRVIEDVVGWRCFLKGYRRRRSESRIEGRNGDKAMNARASSCYHSQIADTIRKKYIRDS